MVEHEEDTQVTRRGTDGRADFLRASKELCLTFTQPRDTARLGQHGPDYPCVLIGDRDRRAVITAPLAKLVDPGLMVWTQPALFKRS